MAQDDNKLAESIRSGAYYGQARGWFETLYIRPVSERTFFLIIALLSAAVAFVSISAVVQLMPLKEQRAVIVPAGDRADDIVRSLGRISANGEDPNPALLKFFVGQYVVARESYSPQSFNEHALFVRAQSDGPTYAAYAQAYTPTNPASPFAQLGEDNLRMVEIRSIDFGEAREGLGTAEVGFATRSSGIDSTSQWTAKIEYKYSPMERKLIPDPETGMEKLEVSDPSFQVVKYVLEKKL